MPRLACLPIALLALLLNAGVAAAQAPPPCTPAQLAGARTPLTLDEGDGVAPDKLISGRRYTAVVVEELGISDFGSYRDGSYRVTSPSVALKQGSRDGRSVYDFTAPRKGPVAFTVSWVIEERGNAANACSASKSVSRGVESLRRVKVGRGKVLRPTATTDIFALQLTVPKPALSDPVTVLVRARRGATRPPRPRGPATYTARLRPGKFGNFSSSSAKGARKLRRLGLFGSVTGRGKGLSVGVAPEGNIPFGRRIRFAFSMEVRQSGKRLGGYRAAASCERFQKRGYSVVRCRVSRSAQKP